MNTPPTTGWHHDAHADEAHDIRIAMLRCVVAAETYRVTGQLPAWAQDGR